MTLISIITPSFNQADYLSDLIISIKKQSYRPIEHIIVDGGSSDGTVDLLHAYCKNPCGINVSWLSEKDRGQAHAVNKGFALARGEVIGWINSDDVYFHTGVFERVVKEFARHPEVDVIHANVAKISKNNLIGLIWCIPDFCYERMFVDGKVSQPTVFFRRKVMENNKLLENLLCLDYEYWLRIGRKFTFMHINDVFAGDRDQPDRISRTRTQELLESHKVTLQRYNFQVSPIRHAWYSITSIPQRGMLRGIGLFTLLRFFFNRKKLAFDARFDNLSIMIRRQLFSRIGTLFNEND